MPELTVIDLGREAYRPALELQQRCVEHVKRVGGRDGYLILVEHDPPVITRGRRGGDRYLLATADELAARGVELVDTSRGGDVTYHGPGQLVGYPVFNLSVRERSVHRHIRNLEELLIRLLARYDIAAGRVEGLTGVWVEQEKVAAIGIAVTRWVTYHGFALNVTTDLSHFDWIVPCGIADKAVTSMSRLLRRDVSMRAVKADLVECAVDVLGFSRATPGTPDNVPPPSET